MASTGNSSIGPSRRDEERYQYQPLDPENNEIRLLKLYPTDPSRRHGEPVECSLIITSLEDALSYKALSYTWGSQRHTEAIFLDRRGFKITLSLETALLQLRSDRVRLVWIDALCINQDDSSERSEQVSKMRTIYERAEEVLVWLGPSTGGVPLAFDLFEDLYQHHQSQRSVHEILKDKNNIKSLEAVRDLFLRDY
jgi:hypothetical protein